MPTLPVATAVAGVAAPLPTVRVYAQVLLSAATVTGAGMLMVVPRSAAAMAPPPTFVTAPPQPVDKVTVAAEAATLVRDGSVTESAPEEPPVMLASTMV